ncbi:MAG: arsenite methyltransferase [Candidatus Tectomicrobia bacterium]|uniref:Arsenite methyltransferase n=1 Tax=Tectimicrobiota bacterium TaxID=2528274 RepID=A0A933LQC1_UNCTE|nr:arsenite methyltransferase [Candidatus Tectomicrobia bacterium]
MSSGITTCCGAPNPSEKEELDKKIKEEVKKAYAAAIKQGSCCGSSGKTSAAMETALKATKLGYQKEELSDVPQNAAQSTFGCGNPLAFSGVKEGDIVLDLGSGAGLDCFLAAKRVGPAGRVIGLDMTPDMIEKATANAREGGYSNVEFRLGEMELMPVENNAVDWVISNCVINLSPDKRAVFSEAFRVLRPGGRVLISDIVTNGIPEDFKKANFNWSGCIGGALEEKDYLDIISQVGFKNVRVVNKVEQVMAKVYEAPVEKLSPFSRKIREEYPEELGRKILSVQIYAEKP